MTRNDLRFGARSAVTAEPPDSGERWISGLIGGLLLLGGLRMGWRGTIAGATAGMLLHRALSGRTVAQPERHELAGAPAEPVARRRPEREVAPSAPARMPSVRDLVQEASEESFPASDAPAFTTTITGPPERH